MAEQFDRVFALLKFDRDDLIAWLADYFGFNETEGTDCYQMTRVKGAFQYDTVTVDDFEEFDHEMMGDLADFILTKLRTPDERT